MHAWQPGRLSRVFRAIEETGLTRASIARIAGVHRSQVGRWFSGEQRPGYDTAMRIAGYLQREHPQLADEFTAAAGYGGPVEPEAGPLVSEDLERFLRSEIRPAWRADGALALLEAYLRGEPPPGTSGDAAGRHGDRAAAS